MAEIIYKYLFQTSDIVKIKMPNKAQILKVDMQGDQPCIWAKVNPDGPEVVRLFQIFGTDKPVQPLYSNMIFYDTYFQNSMVWHVFGYEGWDDEIPLEGE